MRCTLEKQRRAAEEAAAKAEQRVAEARRSGALEAEAARTELRASAERAEGLERSQRPGALAEAWSARREWRHCCGKK